MPRPRQRRARPDGVRTAVELTAASIADQIRASRRRASKSSRPGGCHHPVLWEALVQRLGEEGRPLHRFDDLFFPGDAKEAVAFALLAYLCAHGQPRERSRGDGCHRPPCPRPDHSRMTSGRLLMPALRWREGEGFSHEESTIAAALELGAGGFVLFGGTEDDVRSLTKSYAIALPGRS
jgi:hypothetical protein